MSGLPRLVHPPASPERILGSPRLFFGLWLLRLTSLQFALVLWSFGGAQESLSGTPRIAALQLSRFRSLRLPRSHFRAGSMMNPGCLRTLHPRLAPQMNLRL